jgi:hypothetical protein
MNSANPPRIPANRIRFAIESSSGRDIMPECGAFGKRLMTATIVLRNQEKGKERYA